MKELFLSSDQAAMAIYFGVSLLTVMFVTIIIEVAGAAWDRLGES